MGLFSHEDLGQYVFFGIGTWQKHCNNYWNEKKKLMQIHVGLALNLECKKAGDVRKSSRMVGPQ